jgi:hypothetical protein
MSKSKLRRCRASACRRLTMREYCDDHREAVKTESTTDPIERLLRLDIERRREQLKKLGNVQQPEPREAPEEPQPQFAIDGDAPLCKN